MKHGLKILLSIVILLGLAFAAQAQGAVKVFVSGQNRGAVPSVQVNGVTYVDAQKTARKLGLGAELFAQSKQVKITARGFYAILTVPLTEIIVSAHSHTLQAPVIISGGAVMAPAEFFVLPQLQRALGKEISFSKNTFWVERPYDLERVENVVNARENQLVFAAKKPVSWTVSQPNKHTVEVVFPGGSLKRDESFRFHTDYVASAQLRQERDRAVLKIILGKQAKDWGVTRQDGKIRVRVAASPAPAVPAESAAAPLVASAAVAQETAATAAQAPSVLTEEAEDGFEEMPQETPGSAVSPAVLAQGTADQPVMSASAQTASTRPVIKAEPEPVSISAAKRKIRIVVDPGHGGKDAGAVRGRYREKDWNLSVGNELARLLKKGGFEVQITRSTDVFIALGDRAKMSNNFKADLFVSIHTNASKNSQANGFQVYFRSEKATDKEAAETAALENEALQYEEVHYNFVDALLQSLVKNEYINESSKLAGYVRNAVYKQPGIGIAVNQNNSVRQANFYVLKGVQCPSILVEMGFISSQKDRARLSNKAAREKMAQGIYNGIVSYTKKELGK